ncbi:hypothetical protein [Oryzihumus leptocrescens]|uniref:Uncharacterized protein n=1 Tax=Oryzihumus leptocrescens TaxID=297536 RepID=A0A542ZJP7_9MICO|nr:hypothetical protein [Oryzihumus leptocrescens]TQL60554.1 hypothetical protein FB474_1949 [Oryzihumus leptocrescens]
MTDQSTGREQAAPPVGSVAEEAARLVEAFAAWSGRHAAAPRAAGEDDDEPGDDEPYAGRGDASGSAEGEDAPEGSGEGRQCPTCGAQAGVGKAASCGVCPVCQGIAWLRTVRPETLDRLADLAGALTDTLREVAREAAHGRPQGGTTGGAQHPGASVQDIPVADDDIIEKRAGQ